MTMLRLSARELGRLSGVHYRTIEDILKGSTKHPSVEVCAKIDAAMAAEEMRVRDWLVGMHGNGHGPQS